MNRPPSDLALLRYQAISAYLSLRPPRGQRTALLRQLAEQTWRLPDGRQVQFAAETLRAWVRRFRRGGIEALEDKPRPRPGVQILDPEHIDILCRLKRDVPARSIDRVIRIARSTEVIPSTVPLSRSTVHRVLQAHGLSKRKQGAASTDDLDRFEAAFANDLWQSDMLMGPWLPDPDKPGKKRRAWLHAFIDDHSRLLLAGRWDFKSDLPVLELAFKEALRRFGTPKRVYYDNGGPYRSHHMAQIVAVLSDRDSPIFCTAGRPEGKGKIEAFNRYCRAAFVAEAEASPSVTTVDDLNRAWRVWLEREYNQRPHEEIGETPWERWRRDAGRVVHVDERRLAEAFLFRKTRTTDKAGVLKLLGTRYQVGPELARKRVEVRYDPEDLATIEVWHGETFQERVRPLEVHPQRRPRKDPPVDPPHDDDTPVVDWLGHMTEQYPPPELDDPVERALAEHQRLDDEVVELLRARMSSEVFDEAAVRAFLERHGPLDPAAAAEAVELVIEMGGEDQHVVTLLGDLIDAMEQP